MRLWKLMVLAACLMMTCVLAALAEGNVPIDEEHFPDEVFRDEVQLYR